MKRLAFLSLLTLATLSTLPACYVPPQNPNESTRFSHAGWSRIEIYFGTDIAGGGKVSDADWQSFVDTQLTPRFPDGLTIISANGQYRGEDQKIIHEPSHLVILLIPDNALAEARQKLRATADIYCQQFKQESVLITESPVDAAFLSPTKTPAH